MEIQQQEKCLDYLEAMQQSAGSSQVFGLITVDSVDVTEVTDVIAQDTFSVVHFGNNQHPDTAMQILLRRTRDGKSTVITVDGDIPAEVIDVIKQFQEGAMNIALEQSVERAIVNPIPHGVVWVALLQSDQEDMVPGELIQSICRL